MNETVHHHHRAHLAGAPGVGMPDWMRAQATATAAEIAAGTAQPGPRDDPARLAARITAARRRAITAAPVEGPAGGPGVRPFAVEYTSRRYLTITVEATDADAALVAADAAIAWSREPASSTHHLEVALSKDWEVNDITQLDIADPDPGLDDADGSEAGPESGEQG